MLIKLCSKPDRKKQDILVGLFFPCLISDVLFFPCLISDVFSLFDFGCFVFSLFDFGCFFLV